MNQYPFLVRPAASRITTKPPTQAPSPDTDMSVVSTLEPDIQTKPQSTVFVAPRNAVLPHDVDDIYLPEITPAIERDLREDDPGNDALEPEDVQASTLGMLPGSGPNRDSHFTRFMETFATDQAQIIDKELLGQLNTWLERLIVLHTTAETAIRDFGAAITERGAKIDMRAPELEKLVHQAIWMEHKRDLLRLFKLDPYIDAIMAREIATEFGSALEVEREIAQSKQREREASETVVDSLDVIVKYLAAIKNSGTTAKQQAPSVFTKLRPGHPVPTSRAPVKQDQPNNAAGAPPL